MRSLPSVLKRCISSPFRPGFDFDDFSLCSLHCSSNVQNQQEHEQRWALGSFLGVIKQHIQSINPSTLELPWDTWLSLNPECDATAIWLERKFDMPGSGTWFSEYVFSIPLSPSGVSNRRGYPGLIVFECTPTGDVADDLEK